jgi:hypothetical protein
VSKSDVGHASAALENLAVLKRQADSAIEDASRIGADAHAFGARWLNHSLGEAQLDR